MANLGHWVWDDINDRPAYASEQMAQMFGLTVAQYMAHSVSSAEDDKLVHPADRAHYRATLDQAERDGVPYEVEHRAIVNNEVRYLRETGEPVLDDSGRVIRTFGVLQDLTEVRRTEETLRENEARFRLAARIAKLGHWTWDEVERQFTHVSDELAEIHGCSVVEMLERHGTIDGYLQLVHPDDREKHAQFEAQLPAEAGSYEHEYRILRADGIVRQIREVAEIEVDKRGQLLRTVGTLQDITELARTEQELHGALQEADRANAAKSEFLARMSHELRTPMNAILGFGQLLESERLADLTEKQRDYVVQILGAGRHLLVLIDDVLDVAKIESGQSEVFPEPVAAGPVVEQCIGLLESSADARRVKVTHGFRPLDCPLLQVDPTRFKQVVLNLLSNAIKYNFEGGTVEITWSHAAIDRVRLWIRDSGPGVPAEHLSRIFLPFERPGAHGRGIDGTGIGLSISKRLIEMMGGSIGVASVPGAGATFWVEVECAGTPPASSRARAPTPETSAEIGVGCTEEARCLVLYIEDEPANLALMEAILDRRPGTRMIGAPTAEAGLEIARRSHPHLILMDIDLPGMDGFQVMRLLSRDALLQRIPVIAISAAAMPRDIERARRCGFLDYLVKPVDVRSLSRLLDRIEPARSDSHSRCIDS